MNGLYIANFHTGGSRGEGMAMVRGNEILGGDFVRTWSGVFEEDGSQVTARIRVVPCMAHRERAALARDHAMMVTLHGCCSGHDALLQGHPDGSDTPITLELRKAA